MSAHAHRERKNAEQRTWATGAWAHEPGGRENARGSVPCGHSDVCSRSARAHTHIDGHSKIVAGAAAAAVTGSPRECEMCM